MNLFKHITTYFKKRQAQQSKPMQPFLSSNSFEIITSDILQDCNREEFVVLDMPSKQVQTKIEQQGVENMYLKDYFLIGKKCQGNILSVEHWKEIIRHSDLSLASKKDIYFSIFYGIDYRIRKDVWQVLANTTQMKKMTKLSFYQLSDPSKLQKSEIEAIDKDVVRTNAITKNLKQLREILIAYVSLSKKGYTQGMNIIAGVLLKLLQIENDKELNGHQIVEDQLAQRVFWVLIGVMKSKHWQQVFQMNLSGLQRMLGVLTDLMSENVPKILDRIFGLEWDLGIFAQYYLTLCLYNCPPELAPIILDMFLLDGENVLHSLLIRMLVINEEKILGFKDECQLMKFIKTEMLSDTYKRLLKDRKNAHKLQDFQINFLKTCF